MKLRIAILKRSSLRLHLIYLSLKVATKVTDLLDAAGIAYDVYDNIKPNPTIENVTSGVAACEGGRC